MYRFRTGKKTDDIVYDETTKEISYYDDDGNYRFFTIGNWKEKFGKNSTSISKKQKFRKIGWKGIRYHNRNHTKKIPVRLQKKIITFCVILWKRGI